jgi:hypothetical protein
MPIVIPKVTTPIAKEKPVAKDHSETLIAINEKLIATLNKSLDRKRVVATFVRNEAGQIIRAEMIVEPAGK